MAPNRLNWRLPLLAAAAIAVTGLVAFAWFQPGAVSGQGDGASLNIALPTPEVAEGDQRIPVEIHIQGATNLAAVRFDLEFNGEILKASEAAEGEVFETVIKGPFLGSTGREVVCNSPVLDTGIVRYLCVTLRPEPAGPNGEGLIATVFLDAIGSGETDLVLDNVQANQAGEENPELAIVGHGVTIDVAGGGSGINWMIWAPIIGVGAVAIGGAAAFGAMRMRTDQGGKPAAAT